MHKKEACRLCRGSCVVDGNAQQCPKCEGMGAFNCFNRACRHTDMQFARDCASCSGQGWSVTPAAAGSPFASMTSAMASCTVTPAGSPPMVSPDCSFTMTTAPAAQPHHGHGHHAHGHAHPHQAAHGRHPQQDYIAPGVTVVTTKPVDGVQVVVSTNAPQIPGEWSDVAIPNDRCVITQSGTTLHITNTAQSWSPAQGNINVEGKVNFTAGLIGLTAQYDKTAQRLAFSNGCVWERTPAAPTHAMSSVSLAGKWGDVALPGDEVVIVHHGAHLQITNTGQQWSPASGTFDEARRTVTFTSGLVGLTATLDASSQLALSNGTRWARHTNTPPAAAVQQIDGNWQDPRLPGDEVVIVQTGDIVNVTNAAQQWSPATGKMDGHNVVTFLSGLVGLTARFDSASQALHLSNGTQWTRRSNTANTIPQLAGSWGDVSLPTDHLTIVQNGANYTMTNAGQGWSPATAVAQNGELIFTSGILGLKATYDTMTQQLKLSNNTAWERRALCNVQQIGGNWQDPRLPGDHVVITQQGELMTITNAQQGWSPATGKIDEANKIVFTSGLPDGLTAQYDVASSTLHLSNGTQWTRRPDAPLQGKWGDVSLPGDEVLIVQTGNVLQITNATQGWSPATGTMDAHNHVVFTSGLPAGLTAQFDAPTQKLSLSNGTQWARK